MLALWLMYRLKLYQHVECVSDNHTGDLHTHWIPLLRTVVWSGPGSGEDQGQSQGQVEGQSQGQGQVEGQGQSQGQGQGFRRSSSFSQTLPDRRDVLDCT